MNDTSNTDAMIRWLTVQDVLAICTTVSSPSTILRWFTHGYRGVRLKGTRFGGKWATRREWLEEFLAAINEPEQKARPMPPTLTERRESHGNAIERLKAMGC